MYFFIFSNNVNLKNYNNVEGINNNYVRFTYRDNNITVDELKVLQDSVKNDTSIYKQDNLRNFNELMNQTCMTITTNCRYDKDIITNEKIWSCSKIFEKSDTGNICYTWYGENINSNPSIDNYLEDYCKKFGTNECKCINRAELEPYKSIINKIPTGDDCWYRYCMNTDRYFRKFLNKTNNCPNVCIASTFIIAKNSKVKIGEINSVINCGNEKTKPNIKKEGDNQTDIALIIFIVFLGLLILLLILK